MNQENILTFSASGCRRRYNIEYAYPFSESFVALANMSTVKAGAAKS